MIFKYIWILINRWKRVVFNEKWGGHFAPELGGHFELESGAHFKLELGGQYHWNLQVSLEL